MCRIVFIATNLPEVSFHGLFAACEVALSDERFLIVIDLDEVALTLLDRSCYRCEADTSALLVSRYRRGALVTVCWEGVDALAVGIGRCGGTVRHHQIVAVFVSVLFFGSFKGALDVRPKMVQKISMSDSQIHRFTHLCGLEKTSKRIDSGQ